MYAISRGTLHSLAKCLQTKKKKLRLRSPEFFLHSLAKWLQSPKEMRENDTLKDLFKRKKEKIWVKVQSHLLFQ